MRALIFVLICCAMLIDRFALCEETEKTHIEYVRHFLQNYPNRMEKTLALIPAIENACNKNEVDPLLVVIIAGFESSFRSSVTGARGEKGMLQVMPNSVCSNGHELETAEGQIQAGVACLAMSRDVCDGSIYQMISMYASGACRPRTERTKQIVRRRIALFEKWSGK